MLASASPSGSDSGSGSGSGSGLNAVQLQRQIMPVGGQLKTDNFRGRPR